MYQAKHHFLFFTKKEKIGILTILLICTGFVFLPFSFKYFIKESKIDTTEVNKILAQLEKIKQGESSNQNFIEYNRYEQNGNLYKQNNGTIKGTLFYFDPNTISTQDWKKLGVRDKTIATIENYLSKGGRFYQASDLSKIWGFFPNEVDRLKPFVRIENTPKTNYYNANKFENTTYEKKEYTPKTIDINDSDTSDWISLPGIGSKLANRIILYREKLGGFYSLDQIAETYGLPDSTFQKIKSRLKIKNINAALININTATIEELKKHPYIRYQYANIIVQYRTQHGLYTSLEDLKKIVIVTDEWFLKVKPYLKL